MQLGYSNSRIFFSKKYVIVTWPQSTKSCGIRKELVLCRLPVFALASFAQTWSRAAAKNTRKKEKLAKYFARSRYLGIRDYFLSHSYSAPLSSSTRISKVTSNTEAEGDWLQDDFFSLPPEAAPPTPIPRQQTERFDWRLRAPSRLRKTVFDAPELSRKRYSRRIDPVSCSVRQDEPYYDAIQSYEGRFLELLDAEKEEVEAVLKERLSTWSLDRLKEEGYCLTELSGYWLEQNLFGCPVASLTLGPGIKFSDHKFENGTRILLSRVDPLEHGAEVHRGSIVSSTATRITVSFVKSFDIDDGEWRMDVGHSNIMYERIRQAIAYLHHDPAALERDSGADPQYILCGTQLRDVLLRTFEPAEEPHAHVGLQSADEVRYLPHERLEHKAKNALGNNDGIFKNDMRIQSWARRYSDLHPIVVEGDPVLDGLNSTQMRAVATMIGQKISLVHGPPGTGKTKTIIEAVKLLKVHFEVPHPILVCTYTNVAVDNLVEGLGSAGVKPLRVGSGTSMRPSVVPHTLEMQLSKHPLAPTLDKVLDKLKKLEEKISDYEHRISKGEGGRLALTLPKMQARRGALKSQKYALRQQMLKDVVTAADVVCTTCITSACVALKVTDFPVVFLDEASMSTEPASLVPLMKGSCHVCLIGDHKQLPPIITSPKAQALGLGLSLFERLTQEEAVSSIMLDIQYRMHPAISLFPSSEFYGRAIQDGTVDKDGNAHPKLFPPQSKHLQATSTTGNRPSVIFIDHAGAESLKERSRVNIDEAHIVASIVEDLLLNNSQLMGRDIGIIAPYVAQISFLTRLLNRDEYYEKRFKKVLGESRAMQLRNIEIKTVDGFEGREKEVIIFSTVRNNAGGYIGFLADRRRLNVGLTRARRGLFVVGSLTTLKAKKKATKKEKESVKVGNGSNKEVDSWERYANYLVEHGLVVRLEGETLGQALYGNLNAVDEEGVVFK